MEIITRQKKAEEACKLFGRSYVESIGRDAPYPKEYRAGMTNGQIHDELRALPIPVSPDAVDAVMGNDIWTKSRECAECGVRSAIAVKFSSDSYSVVVCYRCLAAAVALCNK